MFAVCNDLPRATNPFGDWRTFLLFARPSCDEKESTLTPIPAVGVGCGKGRC